MKFIGISQTEPSLDDDKWKKINGLALEISRSTDIDTLKKVFMEELSRLIPSRKSFFDLGYTKNGQTHFFDAFSLTMTESELREYYVNYQGSDYIGWLLPDGEAVYYRDSKIISAELREMSPFYNNWLKPMGMYYSIGSTLFYRDKLYGSVTLFRERELDFNDEDVYVLRLLSEHLSAKLSGMYPNGMSRINTLTYSNELLKKHLITNREREIIALLCQGCSNRDIAEALCISESTVKKHNNSIYAKFNVTTRTQLLTEINKNND